MNYLTEKAAIEPGAILKVYVDDEFEGWARLLNQTKARYDTFIDNNIVYVREKWRVQFVEPHEVKDEMTRTELWNQRSLKGFITYRHFVYFGERTWELYIAKYGIPPEMKVDELSDMDGNLDYDDNMIF